LAALIHPHCINNSVDNELLEQFSSAYHDSCYGYLLRAKNQYLIYADFSLRVTRNNLTTTILTLKYDWYRQFSSCMDIIAYDQPGKVYRFTIIYYLLSLTYNTRLQLITQTSDLRGLDSVVMLYSSVNWSEREVWDMYGVIFLAHPDLRRILTDYGFSGFPLRKDFPLTGYQELLYSDYTKNTEYRKVELTQEFRKTAYEKP
jgi:NADH-quinone oxidoreductase subunit C